MTAAFVTASLYALWGLYLLVMSLYRVHLSGGMSRTVYVLSAPYVILGAVVDVACNITAASILFAELPRDWLVTTRLKRHMRTGIGWRYRCARAICRTMLDPFDPTGQHCD